MRVAVLLAVLVVPMAGRGQNAPDAIDANHAPAAAPREVGMLIERVETNSSCGGNFLGVDLLLETVDATGRHREPLFCARWATAGAHPRRLNQWQSCRSFRACHGVGAERASDRVEVECDGEHVTLETSDGQTIVTGPFGRHVIVPSRVPTVSVRHRVRVALVDC